MTTSRKSNFTVGQQVRFKSHEELKRIGVRQGIKVDAEFKYTSKVLTINSGHLQSGIFKVKEWDKVGIPNWWYHEDFFQPVYELDDKFKGL